MGQSNVGTWAKNSSAPTPLSLSEFKHSARDTFFEGKVEPYVKPPYFFLSMSGDQLFTGKKFTQTLCDMICQTQIPTDQVHTSE